MYPLGNGFCIYLKSITWTEWGKYKIVYSMQYAPTKFLFEVQFHAIYKHFKIIITGLKTFFGR